MVRPAKASGTLGLRSQDGLRMDFDGIESARAVPPVAVTLWDLMGLSVHDLIAWLTVVYLLTLLAEKAWSWVAAWTADRKE